MLSARFCVILLRLTAAFVFRECVSGAIDNIHTVLASRELLETAPVERADISGDELRRRARRAAHLAPTTSNLIRSIEETFAALQVSVRL